MLPEKCGNGQATRGLGDAAMTIYCNWGLRAKPKDVLQVTTFTFVKNVPTNYMSTDSKIEFLHPFMIAFFRISIQK